MDGEGDGSKNRKSHDVLSNTSNNSISKLQKKVNNDYLSKEATSSCEVASFNDGNSNKNNIKSMQKINPDEVV